MKQLLANLRLPALIGLIFSLPFMVLDYVNRRQFNEGFPFGLFALMWALGTGFVFTLVPILRDLRAREEPPAQPHRAGAPGRHPDRPRLALVHDRAGPDGLLPRRPELRLSGTPATLKALTCNHD